jgi:hypothetical protein
MAGTAMPAWGDVLSNQDMADLVKSLKDDNGDRTWPRNLTKPWTFRASNDPRDIYTRISTGIPGTQMPSFADPVSDKVLSAEQRWHVANYVSSLAKTDRIVRPENTVVIGTQLPGELPGSPDDPAGKIADGEIFEDSVAIQLPLDIPAGMEKPYFGMGDPTHAVNIWQWRSGTSDEAEKAGLINARGIDDIERRDSVLADIRAKGVFQNGTWRVVMSRSLVTSNPAEDTQFLEGKFIPLAQAGDIRLHRDRVDCYRRACLDTQRSAHKRAEGARKGTVMVANNARNSGVMMRLFGVILMMVGVLDSMLAWRGRFAVSDVYVLLVASGIFIFFIGAVQRGSKS